MGKSWPAIDVRASGDDADLAIAAADDHSPTAIEPRGEALRIFFSSTELRARALAALSSHFEASAVDVDDEDWARRSQLDLEPITVGRIVVYPAHPASAAHPAQIAIAIPPSMGFGTGHHATTRLCLAALQRIDLRGKFVLDVGTGSGLLAIAAVKLGAARALGTDCDVDALQAAAENVALNDVTDIELAARDVMNDELPATDVVVANLTGALIVRAAPRLVAAVKAGGVLILSGILATEEEAVRHAFANHPFAEVVQQDEWLGIAIRFS